MNIYTHKTLLIYLICPIFLALSNICIAATLPFSSPNNQANDFHIQFLNPIITPEQLTIDPWGAGVVNPTNPNEIGFAGGALAEGATLSSNTFGLGAFTAANFPANFQVITKIWWTINGIEIPGTSRVYPEGDNGLRIGILIFDKPLPNLVPLAIPNVPIPAAIWLFGSALIGFIGIRKKTSVLST